MSEENILVTIFRDMTLGFLELRSELSIIIESDILTWTMEKT